MNKQNKERLYFWIQPEDKKALKKLADYKGLSVSGYVNTIIRKQLSNPNSGKISRSDYTKEPTEIYVMIDKSNGYYKIGRSKNADRREKTLQSEKPTIELMFKFGGVKGDEKILHEMFKEKRIRGEWFDLNGSDLINIKEYSREI